MSTTTAADRAGRAGSSDPLGSIGWTERTGGVLTVRECVTLQTGAQGRLCLRTEPSRLSVRYAVDPHDLARQRDHVGAIPHELERGWLIQGPRYVRDAAVTLDAH
jgi:hypothetical protein